MMYLYALLYFSIMPFTIQNVTSKNHFKGKFLKDLVKIKRLVQFKNSLCSEIDDMLKNSESQLLSEIKAKVCWNDVDAKHEDFPNKKAQEENEDQVASHPILLYKLIKQMNWFSKKKFHHKLQSSASNEGKESYALSRIQPLIKDNLVFPTDDDVSGSTLSLIVIALAYRLHPIELVDGKLGNFHISTNRLTFEDIKHIYTECLRAKHSFFDSRPTENPNSSNGPKEMIHYAPAIEWMEAAEEVAKRKLSEGNNFQEGLHHDDHPILWKKKLEDVQLELQKLRRMHDDNYSMMRDPIYTQQLASPEEFFVRKFDTDTNVTSKQLRMEEAELESNLLSLQEPEMQFRTRNFTRIRDFLTLCRGGSLKFQNNHYSKNNHAKEKCFVSHQDDPFFFLMPLKLEVIMEEPMNLYMFHSALNFQQIDDVQDTIDQFRVILDTYLNEEEEEIVRKYPGEWNYEQLFFEDQNALPMYKTSRLLDRITKLQVTSPELKGRESEIPMSPDLAAHLSPASDYLMAGTYTPGGFYHAHYDEVDGILLSPLNKRIATAIVYFSDVEGGATVFPNIGRTVYPSKGSVIFWNNLHSDGIRNEYSLHGGCPVIQGIKTIGNKAIHYHPQMFKKPCIDNDRKPKSSLIHRNVLI